MPAPDDARTDEPRRHDQASGARSEHCDPQRDGTVDRILGGVEHNVERVAHKVKGLLRSRD